MVDGDFSYISGYEAARKLMERSIGFDGVFCSSDNMAIGFMDYIHHHTDLQIPRDFSLVGFDGAPIPNEELYPLTTYEQPLPDMVARTVDAMIAKIEHFSSDPTSHLFYGRILERGTVRDRR